MEEKKISYKELSNNLEAKIKMLDNPNIELEESVKIYDEAVKLYKECKSRLTEMEGYLIKITKGAENEIVEEPISAETPKK